MDLEEFGTIIAFHISLNVDNDGAEFYWGTGHAHYSDPGRCAHTVQNYYKTQVGNRYVRLNCTDVEFNIEQLVFQRPRASVCAPG